MRHIMTALSEDRRHPMSVTIIGIGGVILIAIFLSIYLAYRRRRVRTKRLMTELLSRYFRGDIPADQVGERTREITSRHFTRSAEFYSLAIAAFQTAADAKLANQAHSKEDEDKLLRLLAALKGEFGLTDRYRIEAWRPGRE
jgi:hypothetical protein